MSAVSSGAGAPFVSMTNPAAINSGAGEWLRGRNFDLCFIVGVAVLALTAGGIAAAWPSALVIVLATDTWVLGYQHVIATYTRIGFDRASTRANRFLIVELPIVVLLATAALAAAVGLWVLLPVYLYWQSYHYTRQSFGISRAYRRRVATPAIDAAIGDLALYSLPLWGILSRSAAQPDRFVGMELHLLPVPAFIVEAAGIVASVSIAGWLLLRVVDMVRGRLALAHALYLLSHFTIFYVGYFAIADLTAGWLVLNVWHSAQYLLFVWHRNNRQYSAGVVPSARLISYLSQSRNVWLYGVVCLLLSTGLYLGIRGLFSSVAVLLVLHQALNFHHYLVDAVIWRRSRPASRIAAFRPIRFLASRRGLVEGM